MNNPHLNVSLLFRVSANTILLLGLTAGISSGHPFQDTESSANIQVVPNMEQKLTPLAPRKARFEALNPGLTDFPDYVVGQLSRQL
jgi:hypothetical protein